MKKVLIFGGSGLVGSKFIELHKNYFNIKSPQVAEVDIIKKDQVKKEVEEFNPDSIVNFAAYTNVEEAEKQKDDESGICYQVNVIGAKNIAEVASDFDKHLIQISTEYVFDGSKENSPYVEEDIPKPINWYGRTKYLAETKVLESNKKTTIMRISMPYSSYYDLKKDVVRFFLEQLKIGNKVSAIEDQRITPTLVDDIANSLKVFLENKSEGIYHVSSRDSVSPLELVKTIAKIFQLDYSLISSTTLSEYSKNKKSKLLKNSWLNPAKFEKEFGDEILHTVEEGIIIFKNEIVGVDLNK